MKSEDAATTETPKIDLKKIDGLWFDVGLIKGTTSTVQGFLVSAEVISQYI